VPRRRAACDEPFDRAPRDAPKETFENDRKKVAV
jgi:hypothetical protein